MGWYFLDYSEAEVGYQRMVLDIMFSELYNQSVQTELWCSFFIGSNFCVSGKEKFHS